jgi:hypothetical protein
MLGAMQMTGIARTHAIPALDAPGTCGRSQAERRIVLAPEHEAEEGSGARRVTTDAPSSRVRCRSGGIVDPFGSPHT